MSDNLIYIIVLIVMVVLIVLLLGLSSAAAEARRRKERARRWKAGRRPAGYRDEELSGSGSGAAPAGRGTGYERLQKLKVLFRADSADLDAVAERRLEEFAAQFRNGAAGIVNIGNSVHIRVTGSSDTLGSAARNRKLAGERAQAVKKKLATLGVPVNRIETGTQEPRDAADEARRQLLRCADISVEHWD